MEINPHMSKLRSIQKLEELSPYEISMLIRNDHPQIIAQICFHMSDTISSEVLSHFSERLRNDVMLRISTLSIIDKYWLHRLDESLLDVINSNTHHTLYQSGLEKCTAILKQCDNQNKSSVLNAILEYEPELHESICNQMLVFEDIFDLSASDCVTLVSSVDLCKLAIALKGIEDATTHTFVGMLSSELASSLHEEIQHAITSKHHIDHIISCRREILKSLQYLIDTDKITSVSNEWI